MALKKLPRSFYLRPTVQVAKGLLCKYLVRQYKGEHRKGRGSRIVGKIVEVEAYCERDPASHSYRGMTQRNRVMFGNGGHLYVYFTYGMHFCSNVVTRERDIGEAVLIRAVEPVKGIRDMMRKRGYSRLKRGGGTDDKRDLKNLTNGPAKVCQAFGIDRKLNGVDLTGDEVFIAGASKQTGKQETGRSHRVGVTNGQDKRWRFYVKRNKFVSKLKTPT